jgi:CRISPR/Cas system endoribonuclease Cas6 (RAMP superfamily)
MSHPNGLNVCLVSSSVSNSLHTTVTPALNYCIHLCCQNDYSTIDPPHQFAPDIQMKTQKKSRNPEIQMKLGVRPLASTLVHLVSQREMEKQFLRLIVFHVVHV